MSFLFEVGLKSIGLLVLIVGVDRLLRGRSFALRHRVWAVAFVGLALLPLLAFRLPEIRLERPGKSIAMHSIEKSRTTFVPATSTASVPAMPTPPASRPSTSGDAPIQILASLWALGAAFLLLRLAFELFVARDLARRGEDLTFDPTVGVPRHTRVVRTSSVGVPVTFGFLRPIILLPKESSEWSSDRLRAVLLHEGAHIRRGDWAWMIFARLVGAFYWPNPLVFYGAARMRMESELASDADAVRSGVDARTYAETLVDLATDLRGRSMGAALPFVETGSLKARVSEILKSSASGKPLGRIAAIVALVLGLGVVAPYAAMRVIVGPETIRGGIFDLGDGHIGEIVAITEMDGDKATSWDMHGALLRRPFPIGDLELNMFGAVDSVRKGWVARYLIFRVEDDAAEWPSFYSKWDEPLMASAYAGPSLIGGGSFRDALGGSYRILRLLAHAEDKETTIHLKAPASDWKLVAYQSYRKGEMTGVMNTEMNLRLSPVMPSRGRGTEASFVLPPETAEDETRVRFLPLDTGGGRFQGVVGPATASTNQDPESISRVEILTRSLKNVNIAEIPLRPNLSATYVPRNFLPKQVIDAQEGNARLTNGFSMSLFGAADRDGRIWTPAGVPSPGAKRHLADASWLSRSDSPSRRLIRLLIDESDNNRENASTLFDTEGWPLFHSVSMVVDRTTTNREFMSLADNEILRTDIVVPVPSDVQSTAVTLRPHGANVRQWKLSSTGKKSGTLGISYDVPADIDLAGYDISFVALDAQGREVVNTDGSLRFGLGPGWVSFDFPPDLAARVASVGVLARRYDWVRFRDVALAPTNAR